MLNEITSCEVCGNDTLSSVLDLGNHPMCDDLVAVGDDRQCREYPIEIMFCNKCLTAHQKFQIPKQELFPQTYHYRSRHTGDVLNGMKELVSSVEKNHGSLNGKKVVDIGCNDGSLLSFFREKGATTYGIEPTGAYKDAQEAGHEVINDFFSEAVATAFVAKFGNADVITFTNVFAHIEDLAGVVRALKILMNDTTVIVIENHYLGAVLEKFQFDTFYHEHPRTYSYTSFAHIGDSLGLRIGNVDFPARYNGNIRVSYVPKQGQTEHAGWAEHHGREQSFGEGLKDMARKLGPWREQKRAEIEEHVKAHGKLCAKAFPGRAAIPVKMLDLDETLIKAAYEKPQSGKIGHYIPGTRIPIVSDDEFDLTETKTPLLNLAWHIGTEIKNYMQGRGYKGPIIDIISAADKGTNIKKDAA